MKIKETNAIKHIQYILENTNTPVAALELDGTFIQENDIFYKVFQVERNREISNSY